jgi:hypothetical protein
VDLLDFYRGTLSARRLGVLVRQLPVESALVRALNDGRQPWQVTDHLIADLWALTLKVHSGDRPAGDHPVRAEMEAKARTSAKLAKVIELRTVFENRKRTYGLG